MKKYLLTLVVVLMVFVIPCQAQSQRLKLAVYATGNVAVPLKNIAQNTASTELVNGGRYQMIERSSEFLNIVSTEQNYQRSGAVDDSQIADLGKQYGADCVCVVDITHVEKYMYVAIRMIDVVAATSKRAGYAENANYISPVDLRKCVTEAVEKMEGANPDPSYKDNNSSGNKISGHEYVDLGLSVKWATCNVGANKPEDYGNYYAWGETKAKLSYDIGNSVTYGRNFGDIGGDSQYDAATANWGSSWRLPTGLEMRELIDNCTWTWTTQGGKKGYKVTGPNGNSIFLPAAGYRYGSSLSSAGVDGYYWGSTPDDSNSYYAWYLYFYSGVQDMRGYYRDRGRSVRPVTE